MTPYQRADAFESAFPEMAAHGARFVRGRNAEGQETIYATFFGGGDYRNKSRLYGSYPKSYLERMFSMFPDAKRILHLFSGSLTAEQVTDAWWSVTAVTRERASKIGPMHLRFDNALHPIARAAKPDVIGNAEELGELIVDHVHTADCYEGGVYRMHDPEGLNKLVCGRPWNTQEHVPRFQFDLVLADPPYRLPDQRRYWREAMFALSGDCAVCALPVDNGELVAHAPVYRRSTHEGAIVCVDRRRGKIVPTGELQLNGYVRFKPLNKKLVVEQCAKVLAPGGTLVWLDESLVQFSKRDFRIAGTILWVRSTMHRFRVATLLERGKT